MKKALWEGLFRKQPKGLAAFAGALAGVLLATGCHATLQADSLATAAGWQSETRLGCGTGGSLAISFGNDFVAHLNFQEKK
jgi:hypothetical protein